ncbi:MAG TPA: acyltransferase [Steroidobacteraceae bacterium]|jgi:peptidoglycan/LPS O-acetylase OafA/YrhL|nr:acyltransferase [Steroidobacteraceae bacterium]
MPKTNNFDLIRLAAALQVAFTHTLLDLGMADRAWPVRIVTDMFPGVPVFFFISGFLISKSFEKNPVVREFALNRGLRIYPGLAVCFLVSLASVWWSGYFRTVSVPPTTLALWAAAQLSIGQFFNPAFMRHYGVGVLNGSVWTICVELQFYLLVPLLYAATGLRQLSARHANAVLLTLIALFVIANQAYLHITAAHSRPLWYRVAGVSFAPWFYMFLVGVFFQRNFTLMQRCFGGRFIPVLIVYCALGLVCTKAAGWGFGNSLNPPLFTALSIVTFAAAFSGITLSERLLRRNDLSYGVYLYHQPVSNFLLANGWSTGLKAVLLAVAAAVALAYVSWRVIEKPALGLKRHPLYPHRLAPLALPAE